jgi:hypothetical protein
LCRDCPLRGLINSSLLKLRAKMFNTIYFLSRFCNSRYLKRLTSAVSAEHFEAKHGLKSLIPLGGASVYTNRSLRTPYRKLRESCLLLRRKAHYHASQDIYIYIYIYDPQLLARPPLNSLQVPRSLEYPSGALPLR